MNTRRLDPPAEYTLAHDAADLARIAYGLTLVEVCRRKHCEKRAWIAGVLLRRGWDHAGVARVLRYQHSTSMDRSLHLAVVA